MLKHYVGGIDHIALQVSSLEDGLRFFHELLGFKVRFKFRHEGKRIVQLSAGKIEIEMWEQPNGSSPQKTTGPFQRHGVNHIAIAVKNLDRVLAEMQKQGYELAIDINEPTRGIREAVILGPDDLEIQFIEQNVPLLIWRSIKGDFKQN